VQNSVNSRSLPCREKQAAPQFAIAAIAANAATFWDRIIAMH
jgi:hypothetical protein